MFSSAIETAWRQFRLAFQGKNWSSPKYIVFFVAIVGCHSSSVSQGDDDPAISVQKKSSLDDLMLDLLCRPEAAIDLLGISAVQSELDLQPEQIVSLESIARGLNNEEDQPLQKLQVLLRPNQIKRLNQLCFQREWVNLIAHPKVGSVFDFTAAQEDELLRILGEDHVAVADTLKGAGTRDEKLERKSAILAKSLTKRLQLLTPLQKAILKELKGPEFRFSSGD